MPAVAVSDQMPDALKELTVYLIQIDHVIYEPRGGGSFTLSDALRELHGCGHARILRIDGTVAVDSAGSDYAVRHAPTGRLVKRRRRSEQLAENARLRAYAEQRVNERRPA
jgi:hypothetical protein